MKNPGMSARLASNKYVTPRPGKAPMVVKATTQMPSHKTNMKTPAQRKGFHEDEGKC